MRMTDRAPLLKAEAGTIHVPLCEGTSHGPWLGGRRGRSLR